MNDLRIVKILLDREIAEERKKKSEKSKILKSESTSKFWRESRLLQISGGLGYRRKKTAKEEVCSQAESSLLASDSRVRGKGGQGEGASKEVTSERQKTNG